MFWIHPLPFGAKIGFSYDDLLSANNEKMVMSEIVRLDCIQQLEWIMYI